MESLDQLRDRLEQAAGGGPADGLTVRELAARFLRHGETAWSPRTGQLNNSSRNYELALRPMVDLYGDVPAADLGPLHLRAVGLYLAEGGRLCAGTMQDRVKRIRRCIRWAVGRGLLAPAVAAGLAAVETARSPLAPVRPRVQPVSLDLVNRTLAWLEGPRTTLTLSTLATLIQLQLWTGMRPGEVCAMRGQDVEPGTYRPASHKNTWRGQERVVSLGPKAQALLMRWLRPGFLFTTRTGKPWTVQLYGQQLRRTCDAAGLPRWTPNQLRHLWAVLCRKRAGLEAAQEGLGHRTRAQTEHYAPAGLELVSEYNARYG